MSKRFIAGGHAPAAFAWTLAQDGARAFSAASDPTRLLGGTIAAADVLVVMISSVGVYFLRNGSGSFPSEIAATTLLTAVLTVNAMLLAGCYTRHITDSLANQILRAAKSFSAVLVILVILAYFTKTSDGFSRLWAIGFYASVLAGVALVRVGAALKLQRWRRRGRLARTVAVVDLSGGGQELARRLMRASVGEMWLAGVFSPASDNGQSVTDLIALSRLFRIDEVFVSVSGRLNGPVDTVETVIRRLGSIPATVRLCPEMPELTCVPREPGLLYGHPVLTVHNRPLMGWSRVVKRTEDVVLSSLAIILLAPVMAIIAAAIKLDSPGPVLFKQKRPGFNNKVITVYKFRSMVHELRPEHEIRQAQRNDPRITRVGRYLRRASVDELPQLFNVLGGGMSLVGPRPHAVSHNDQYSALIDDYLARHRVQPGITGWAQVNGLRGETKELKTMKLRVEHDLAYIDNWSLMLDMRILFRTLFLPFFDRNAY